MNSKLDEHAPLKRIDKYKLKFKSKPWRTPAIQKSVIVKKKKNLKGSKMQNVHKQMIIDNIEILEICYLHFKKKQVKLLQSIFQS